MKTKRTGSAPRTRDIRAQAKGAFFESFMMVPGRRLTDVETEAGPEKPMGRIPSDTRASRADLLFCTRGPGSGRSDDVSIR